MKFFYALCLGLLFIATLFGRSIFTSPFPRATEILPEARPVVELQPYIETLEKPARAWSGRDSRSALPAARRPLSPYQRRVRSELEAVLRRYAPRLWWHPDERYGPMDPLEFVQRSSVWMGRPAWLPNWKEDDRQVSGQGQLPAAALRGLASTSSVGFSNYLKYEGQLADFRTASAEELTRVPILWRLNSTVAPGLLGRTPKGRARIMIEYWYYSAYNDATPIGIGNHEGDWEGVAMVVELGTGKNGQLTHELKAAYYAAHEGGAWHCASDLDWTEEEPSGEKHPVAYSALGTHATFPTEGRQLASIVIDRTGRGKAWDSWTRLLPLELEPYYGFTGRWGPLSAAGFMSGPYAPGPRGLKARPRIPRVDLHRCGLN